jgi:transglutaminase-like putative cysteine protease
METDISLRPGVNASPDVRDRVRIGPLPDWVKPCVLDIEFKVEAPSHCTHLLLCRQIHAETKQTYVHTAARLETMQSVQHNSQWQLQFEPRTQLVTLHWIRVHRSGEVRDCANFEKIRLLQREAGLERFMIQGWFTILLLLEDVRPGDVVETCYTIESQPEILRDNCTHVFALPTGVAIGQFQFSVHHKTDRALKWRSSAPELKPEVQCENGAVIWTWKRENYQVPEAEINTPPDWIVFPWIQVSDCADWGVVADAAARAWSDDRTGPAVEKLMEEITGGETDLVARASKAIQIVQDDFRYLNVDLDHGGHVPSAPETVAQRRYGDCKDLSLLLVRLLKNLQIPARPILVNNRLGRSVNAMLPMPELFNHAIVEFKLQDTVCWVDPVLKLQGGNALNRFIPDYGAGLPVDSAAKALSEPPRCGNKAAIYELTESILLDSTGALSPLSVLVRATGFHAESMRNQLAGLGKVEMGKQRLQHYTQRFLKASRTREIEVRDNRLNNEFFLAETFEIQGFTGEKDSKNRLVFAFPGNLVVAHLALPDSAPRLTENS